MREALEQALAALPPEGLLSGEAQRAAQVVSDRIRRDLLPRLSGRLPTLIAGIAGPNNVGKSTLFNALVGAPLSPARPEGGLTKQCLAAAHPALWAGPLRQVIEARYEVVQVAPGSAPPVTEPGPPGRLYLVPTPSLPEGLLLMDTPDFDSVHQTNRRAAEALLVTVDVVLFVISRHTYQNAAVVAFLRDVVGQGRPYALVYNEALREEVAREHLDKLARDVGQPPVSRQLALHQPEVDVQGALLKLDALDGPPLPQLLRDPEARARLKARALAASYRDARTELLTVAQGLEDTTREPERLRSRLRRELLQLSERAAGLAIPADVLIEAFRDELDARSATHKWIRRGPRLLAAGLTRVGRFLKTQFTGPEPSLPPVELRVQDAIASGVREVVEALAPEVAAWRGDEEIAALLRTTFSAATLNQLPEVPEAISEAEVNLDRERLYRFCREILAEKMPHGPGEELRQLGATFAYAVPALVGMVGAAVVPGVTGGADVVFASALVTTPLLERFVDLLGAGVRDAVAQSWRASHGRTIAAELEQGPFRPLLSRLDQRVEDSGHAAQTLRRCSAQLAEATAKAQELPS